VKDKLAAAGGRVDLLGEAFELYALPAKRGECLDQMGERTLEPVQFPNDQGVAFPKVRERQIKARSAGFCATDFIGEDVLFPTAGFFSGHRSADLGFDQGLRLERSR
jgi:hypothetical protein